MTYDSERNAGQQWTIIMVPYDGGSQLPGSASGVASWAQLLEARGMDYVTFPRELGAALPYCLEAEVKGALHEGALPLMIGGDHSLTFFSVKALAERYGALNILLFDAHHDGYKEVNLSNYSVFYHLAEHYGAHVKTIGCRHDLDSMPRSQQDLSRPTYVSVDADFFDPGNVPSVSNPVAMIGDLNHWQLFEESLAQLKTRVVGADIVEWCGSSEPSEIAFVGRVFDCVYRLRGKS